MRALDTYAASLRARDAELRSTSHLHARVAENRRSGGRGSGRRGGGGVPGYNPLASTKLIETWLSYLGTTDDGAGLISAWAGQRAGKIFTAATTKRPTLTASQFGTKPGLVFDGVTDVMQCATVGALITGKTSLTVIGVVSVQSGGVGPFAEYSTTAWFSEAGTWFMSAAATAAVSAGGRGDAANTYFTASNNTAPLVLPGVLSFSFDFTQSAALEVPGIQLDNVALAGTNTPGNNTSSFANKNLSIGARSAGTAATFISATFGALAIYDKLTAAELTTETRGLGGLLGGIVVA